MVATALTAQESEDIPVLKHVDSNNILNDSSDSDLYDTVHVSDDLELDEDLPVSDNQLKEKPKITKKVSYATVSSTDSSAQLSMTEKEDQTTPLESNQWENDQHKSNFKFPPVTKVMRRATTVDVPRSGVVNAFGLNGTNSPDDKSIPRSPVLTRSISNPERAAAVEAIRNRDVRFRFSTSRSVREIVRSMYSHRIREFPTEIYRTTQVEVQVGSVWRKMDAEIDREGFWCSRISLFRKKKKDFRLGHDDIIGATVGGEKSRSLFIHFMTPGRGANEKRLKRRYRTLEVRFDKHETTEQWADAFQALVKWHARVPEACTRKIKVVVNPHSGKRRGRQIWRKWEPLFKIAGIECDMEETQYSGHARDIGASLDLTMKYEALVFVGGDGTVNEFMNGVFAREEADWRQLVATTPIALLSAGTDNAFSLGVGTPTHESSVYCVIKRKIRPLDVVTCQAERKDGTIHREFACCGISYGIGADIAMESERTRWLGVYRYMFLKVKRGIFAPRRHECTLKYVLSDDVEVEEENGGQVLRTYYDVMNENAQDQHHIEMCSVYEHNYESKKWEGDASSIFDPANEEKFAGRWQSETGSYATIGASNVYFETKYAHPSDGNMDLIIARKGNLAEFLDMGVRYIAGDYLKSTLVDYFKIKAMIIEQNVDDPINVDGEVFDGPGPFHIEIVPRLLCVLSEK